VQYLKFPDFLTKEYRIYDPSRVVATILILINYIKLIANLLKNIPFDGLTTSEVLPGSNNREQSNKSSKFQPGLANHGKTI
jgi:hypothetical protein